MHLKNRFRRVAAVAILLASTATPADDSVRHALEERQGRQVTLVLESGSEMTGTVAKVDADSVKLTQLVGKEFFDAVVDIAHVQAVVFRAKP